MHHIEGKLRAITLVMSMFFTSVFGVLIILFPYIPLVFINKKLFHRLFDVSMRLWFGCSVFLIEKVGKIKIFMHMDKKKKRREYKKGAIILMNHRTRLDWMFYFCILYRMNLLEDIKIILKAGLEKIPGFGWAMQSALFIFIKRKWEEDREIFTNLINHYRRIEKNAHILIFPEGTNLTENTKAKSDQYAKSQNLELYTQVLHPRVTGFAHVYKEMKRNDLIDTVHDVTVAYKCKRIPESEILLIKGYLPEEIHFYIDIYDVKEIVDSSKEDDINISLGNWLSERWRIKETFLKSFYEDGINSNKFQMIQSNYMTEKTNGPSIYYPLFWIFSFLFSLYLCYFYLVAKLYFIVALVFFVFYGKELQNLIVNSKTIQEKKD